MTVPGETRPDHVFVAPSPVRRIVSLLAVAALVVVAGSVWVGWRSQSTGALALAGVAAVVAVACWVQLVVSVPQRVTITGSTVVVRHRSGSQRYDLEDPGVDLLVRDGSVAFGHYRDSWSIVQARDVDWPVFMDVVMRYQSQADVNAEERDRRFSR